MNGYPYIDPLIKTTYRNVPCPWSEWKMHESVYPNQRTRCARRIRKIGYFYTHAPVVPIYEMEEWQETVHLLTDVREIESRCKSSFFTLMTTYQYGADILLCMNCFAKFARISIDVPSSCSECKSRKPFSYMKGFDLSTENHYFKDEYCTKTGLFPPKLKEELLAVAWHPDRPHVFEYTLPYDKLQELTRMGMYHATE